MPNNNSNGVGGIADRLDKKLDAIIDTMADIRVEIARSSMHQERIQSDVEGLAQRLAKAESTLQEMTPLLGFQKQFRSMLFKIIAGGLIAAAVASASGITVFRPVEVEVPGRPTTSNR